MKSTSKIILVSLAAATAASIATQRVLNMRRWGIKRLHAGPQVALITGASSGIGAEFARALARDGYHLVLVARRANRLQALAQALSQRYAIEAEPFPADLADPEDVERVCQHIRELNNLALLVNNAGFGTAGEFGEAPIQPEIDMVKVHIEASMRLTYAALPGMIANHHGGIINVSSLNAFLPSPGNVTYGASKAFLNLFSEALQGEVRGTGVRVQALCPGFTFTELHDKVGFDRTRIPAFLWMPSAPVVEFL